MSDLDFRFDFLSTREGCNKAIRHIEILHDVIKEFESLYNLADKLNDLLADRVITPDQILPILHSLLVDKYSYRYFSYNLEKNIDEFEKNNLRDSEMGRIRHGFSLFSSGARCASDKSQEEKSLGSDSLAAEARARHVFCR
jgi:hypothetical protein